MRAHSPTACLPAIIALGVLLALQACAPAANAPAAQSAAPAVPAAAAPPPASAPSPATSAPVAAPAASAPAAQAAPPLSPPVHVKVGVLGLLTEAGIYIAEERGYFREEGLDIETIPFGRAAEQMAPLGTGELNFGVGAPDASLFNSVARDVGIKLVSPNGVSNQDETAGWLVVRQDLVDSGRYKTPADLKGMRIGQSGNFSIATIRLERILSGVGLTLEDADVTQIPYPDMLAALTNKALDAAILAEPFVTAGKSRGVVAPVVRLAEVFPGVILQAVILSPVFARDEPEAAKRFVVAHLRGQRDYWRAFIKNETSRDDLVPILTKHTNIKDPDLYARMGTHGVDPNGGIDEAVLDELQSYYLRYGTQQQRVDSSKAVDHSYIDYALQRLGRVAP
ncbi:MAG TPA: ABC transporter substrate-binding protein [Chloroflexota bacterium]|jgi:NitT/TauT family transport system substrate-binding protein